MKQFLRSCGVSPQAVNAASPRALFSAAASVVLFLPAQAPADERVDPRWKELGVNQPLLPDDQNPVVAILNLLREVPKDIGWVDPLGNEADITKAEPSPEAVREASKLQDDLSEIIKRPAGTFPLFDEGASTIWPLVRAPAPTLTLAADAFRDGNVHSAISQLAFVCRFSDHLLCSEPSLMEYLVISAAKRTSFGQQLNVYLANPRPDTLRRIQELAKAHRFRPEFLKSALRSEARYTYNIVSRFPEWLRKQNKTLAAEFWTTLSREPLQSCSLDELLSMNYDPQAEAKKHLEAHEATLHWLEASLPLSKYPEYTPTPKQPKPLDYYQHAPNGLGEIFEDCSIFQNWHALIAHQTDDAFATATIAWLRAEADGVAIDSLADLVPKYLASIPLDPCDGKPLRCLPKKRTLYSVGPDLHDDGGRDDLPEPPDGEELDLDATTDRVFVIPKPNHN